MRARILYRALITAFALLTLFGQANASDPPVIEQVLDHDSGATLWSNLNPGAMVLKPGQEILLEGHNFGSGPITAARPGLGPPAGGVPTANGTSSIASSPAEAVGKELSKVLFGNVRAFERNLSSYPARIDLETGATSLFAELQGKVLDYFIEKYQPVPDTWAGDIYAWSDTEIDLTVPITAYEGPIQVVRIPLTGRYVLDVRTGAPLRDRDPNTTRVVDKDQYVFVDGWQIARTDESVLASNTVPAAIAQAGGDRLQYGAPLVAGTSEADARDTRQALESAATGPLRKTRPTMRSAADQYAYGEQAYWAWDWNLALPHLLLGVDWDRIFGFGYDQKDPLIELVQAWKYKAADIARPAIELEGYQFPELTADGTVKQMRLHKAMIDRSTGEGIRPFTSFGAIPLLPEEGAQRLVAPSVAFENQAFGGPTPYPIEMALHLPFSEPLSGGQTNPTGWTGYVFAEAANPVPGHGKTGQWIGFSCAACHASRVTYEYEPGGKRISRIFSGIPNPDWKATFLTLSGRTYGLALAEELPLNFIRYDHPAGTQKRIEAGWGARGLRFLDALGVINEQQVATDMRTLSKAPVDKTLLIYSMPPGATESTLFVPSNDPGDYANDYFFSPQVMPIITNHTPARRALSRSELIDGFEGAYLHGEEPEGARGPMSSRSLQDLTLYTSTLRQEDELLRRIGMYRWLAYKGLTTLLGSTNAPAINEGSFVSFDYPPESLTRPASFPPLAEPSSGLGTVRDDAIAEASGQRALAEPFAQQYPSLAGRLVHGAQLFKGSCARCHSPGNAGLWTNEDMHPISTAGGSEPTGRFFSPTVWQRSVQSIRTAILENLFWVQRRGLLSDGHIVGNAPENMDGLDLLVRPDRCQAPLNADGSVDLARASDLYKRLYTIRRGADHSFRIPSAGMRFELYTRFGEKPGVAQQILAPKPDRMVTEPEARFVERHAYFTKLADGYYYWDYQKMRREYGILEFGLDPTVSQNASHIGGLPATPHPWCLPEGSPQADIDDLVMFLLTL
jgi:mono/diheme cytochrome c family protein